MSGISGDPRSVAFSALCPTIWLSRGWADFGRKRFHDHAADGRRAVRRCCGGEANPFLPVLASVFSLTIEHACTDEEELNAVRIVLRVDSCQPMSACFRNALSHDRRSGQGCHLAPPAHLGDQVFFDLPMHGRKLPEEARHHGSDRLEALMPTDRGAPIHRICRKHR